MTRVSFKLFSRAATSLLGSGHISRNSPKVAAACFGLAATSSAVYCFASGQSPAQVLSCGLGTSGELGRGDNRSEGAPLPVSTFENHEVLRIGAGGKGSFAITSSHNLWTWGNGQSGRLGHGNQSDQCSPVVLEELRGKVFSAFMGLHHSAAITGSGQLFTWGLGNFGQLGLGDSVKGTESPAEVDSSHFHGGGVVCASLGRAHTLCVDRDGRVLAWGMNIDGQLGREKCVKQSLPKQVLGLPSSKAAQVAAGRDFSFVLTTNGELYSFGADDYGQLGIGKPTKAQFSPCKVMAFRDMKVCDIAAGDFHAAAITGDGQLWTWGMNLEGALGNGGKAHQSVPKRVSLPGNETAVKAICGGHHTAVLCKSGHVFIWGRGRDGQLARGSSSEIESIAASRDLPVQVLSDSSKFADVALGQDHSLFLSLRTQS